MSITAVLVTAAAVVQPLVDKVPADKNVKAGWLAAVIFVGLGLAVVFLGFSLTKHLRRAERNLAPKQAEDEAGEAGTKPVDSPKRTP
jgi:hypothetical protein